MGRNIKAKARSPFAERALRLRLEKSLSQWDISTLLGYKSNEYARIETGFRTMRYQLLPNLCKILGVPPDTFDDVLERPGQGKVEEELLFQRLEEIREKVLGMNVNNFCKELEINYTTYNNLKLGPKSFTNCLRRLVQKHYFKDPRISYSFLLEGRLNPELKLRENLQKTKMQLQEARMQIRDLERLIQEQANKIADLEIIKSLATRVFAEQ